MVVNRRSVNRIGRWMDFMMNRLSNNDVTNLNITHDSVVEGAGGSSKELEC